MTDSATLPTDPQTPQQSVPSINSGPLANNDLNQANAASSNDQSSTPTPTPTPTSTATNDASIDELVQQTLQVQQDFQQADQSQLQEQTPSVPSVDAQDVLPVTELPTSDVPEPIVPDQLAEPQAGVSDTSADSGKSPLDILEDILGGAGGEGAGPDDKPAEPTQTPEELAAEIQAERDRVAKEEEAIIEEHRQKMQSELQTPEQQKRDEVRSEQAQQMKTNSQFDIPQIERKKMVLDDKKK